MLDLDTFDDSPHLLDLLLQMEDVLDSLDLYVFKNWFSGEVIEGPIVNRYWLSFVLRYDLLKMPDPRGAKRLLSQNVLTQYEKAVVRDLPNAAAGDKPLDEEEQKPTHWHVTIAIPRSLISDMNAAQLDFYDEDIDVDDVQAAQDIGMTDETGYQTDGEDGTQADVGAVPPQGDEQEGQDAVNF